MIPTPALLKQTFGLVMLKKEQVSDNITNVSGVLEWDNAHSETMSETTQTTRVPPTKPASGNLALIHLIIYTCINLYIFLLWHVKKINCCENAQSYRYTVDPEGYTANNLAYILTL